MNRDEFIKWADKNGFRWKLRINSDGSYEDPTTESAWQGYQFAKGQIAELIKDTNRVLKIAKEALDKADDVLPSGGAALERARHDVDYAGNQVGSLLYCIKEFMKE